MRYNSIENKIVTLVAVPLIGGLLLLVFLAPYTSAEFLDPTGYVRPALAVTQGNVLLIVVCPGHVPVVAGSAGPNGRLFNPLHTLDNRDY